MPKRPTNPILDRTSKDYDFINDDNDRIDDIIDDAYLASKDHPELDYVHFDPDVRVALTDQEMQLPVWPPEVMLDAMMNTPARILGATFRRETVEGLILGLRKHGIELVGVEQRERERSEANANMLLVASGAYTLARSSDGRLVAKMRRPQSEVGQATTQPMVAPQPTAAPMVLPSFERAYAYDQPLPEECEEEPDIDAMLAMMGNLPPMPRNGH